MSATVSSIISFLEAQANPTTALTDVQYNNLVSQLRAQINQLSVAVSGAQPGAVTMLYSGTMGNGVHTGEVAQALAASVGRISLRNPPDERMSLLLKYFQLPPTDNAALIRPTKSNA